jgi:hypothetical protein
MPDKPLWLTCVPDAIRELETDSDAWVDRARLESLLRIGRRRAQQLLAPVASRRVGTSLLAHRDDLIPLLTRMAAGEQGYYDERRRKQLWTELTQARRQWLEQAPVLVEVPNADVRRVEVHDFEGLPEGVELAPGSITVRFSTPDEALEKLLALAMAVSQNRPAFEERVTIAGAPGAPGQAFPV